MVNVDLNYPIHQVNAHLPKQLFAKNYMVKLY